MATPAVPLDGVRDALARMTGAPWFAEASPDECVRALWLPWVVQSATVGAASATWVLTKTLPRPRQWALVSMPVAVPAARRDRGRVRLLRSAPGPRAWMSLDTDERARMLEEAVAAATVGDFLAIFDRACNLAREARCAPDRTAHAARHGDLPGLAGALVEAKHGHDPETVRMLAALRGVAAA